MKPFGKKKSWTFSIKEEPEEGDKKLTTNLLITCKVAFNRRHIEIDKGFWNKKKRSSKGVWILPVAAPLGGLRTTDIQPVGQSFY